MMRVRKSGLAPGIAAALVLSTAPLAGQQPIHEPVPAPMPEQPYANLGAREIKALSPEEVEALRRGDGMGYALAAELNGHPGPRHVLELAVELALSADQHLRVERVFAAMQREARILGEQIVRKEV
ncbi:MAG: hypothetical protein WD766_03620, partial [Gemmatimonadota bacterium]